jgi:hypothetical protein
MRALRLTFLALLGVAAVMVATPVPGFAEVGYVPIADGRLLARWRLSAIDTVAGVIVRITARTTAATTGPIIDLTTATRTTTGPTIDPGGDLGLALAFGSRLSTSYALAMT